MKKGIPGDGREVHGQMSPYGALAPPEIEQLLP